MYLTIVCCNRHGYYYGHYPSSPFYPDTFSETGSASVFRYGEREGGGKVSTQLGLLEQASLDHKISDRDYVVVPGPSIFTC
jgi:hypothetical protein